jgi:hypothetical protein
VQLPGWTREPLVHFLVAGALVFAFFSMRGNEVDPASRVIDVDRETQAQIALGFERMMSRPPTDAELSGLIENYVHDEILYREAIRLGFDRDDAIVRRRLAQKMDMAASARAETERPSDATLRDWYTKHSAKFSEETKYSFDQLWFEKEEEASSGLAQLRGGSDWHQLEGGISLPPSVEQDPRNKVLSEFGELFVAGLDELEPDGDWYGPLPSGFGWHLVRLRARDPGKVPPLEQVREDVEDDWRSATIADRRDKAYQVLRDAYRVEIEE